MILLALLVVDEVDRTATTSGGNSHTTVVIVVRQHLFTHQHPISVRQVAKAVGGIEADSCVMTAMRLVFSNLLIQFSYQLLCLFHLGVLLCWCWLYGRMLRLSLYDLRLHLFNILRGCIRLGLIDSLSDEGLCHFSDNRAHDSRTNRLRFDYFLRFHRCFLHLLCCFLCLLRGRSHWSRCHLFMAGP